MTRTNDAHPDPQRAMKLLERLLELVAAWATAQPEVAGVALLGSHARGEARSDSDIDLLVLTTDRDARVDDQRWLDGFGDASTVTREEYGAVTSLRARYLEGPEVEFAIASIEWARLPLDPGTQAVLQDGVRLVYDRDGRLAKAALASRDSAP